MGSFYNINIVSNYIDILKDKVECHVPVQVVRMAYMVKIIENDDFLAKWTILATWTRIRQSTLTSKVLFWSAVTSQLSSKCLWTSQNALHHFLDQFDDVCRMLPRSEKSPFLVIFLSVHPCTSCGGTQNQSMIEIYQTIKYTFWHYKHAQIASYSCLNNLDIIWGHLVEVWKNHEKSWKITFFWPFFPIWALCIWIRHFGHIWPQNVIIWLYDG